MKFKAKLSDPVSLLHILQALEKLGQQCSINLTPDTVYIWMSTDATGGEVAFVDIKTDALFDGFQIESKSANNIPFLASIPNLLRALRSAHGTGPDQMNDVTIVLRLTKKVPGMPVGVQPDSKSGLVAQPFLSFDMTTASVTITQDVPIILQTMKRVEEFKEPDIPPPEVTIRMPSLKSLVPVIDRMQTISSELEVQATSTGELCLHVLNDSVDVKTFYKNLQYPEFPGAEDAPIADASGLAKMDIKKFSRVLNAKLLDASHVLGCITEHHAFVVYVKLKRDLGTATFYIPLLAQ